MIQRRSPIPNQNQNDLIWNVINISVISKCELFVGKYHEVSSEMLFIQITYSSISQIH